jgi:GNAT superfamily N-acetyltransferase
MLTPNQDGEYVLRAATLADAPLIAEHRALMFRDMGEVAPQEVDRLREASERWVAELLSKDGYFGWLIETQGEIVAGGGIILMQHFPGPGYYRVRRRAHVVNIYTAPDHRRKGLARRMMQHILHWCAQNAVDDVTLGASDQGRPLYESLGFLPTAHMRLRDERYREYFKK